MKKNIKLTESDLKRIIQRIVTETEEEKYEKVMKIVITESQLKKIIIEQEVSDFQDYFDELIKKKAKFKMDVKIPEINLGKGIIPVDDLISKIKKSPFKVTSLYINSEGHNFPIVPASFTLKDGDKTITLSTEPFNSVNGVTMLKLTKSLEGKERQTPKEI